MMDAKTAKAIADQWMIPTPSGAYMAGLENRPIIERAEGIEVIDTTGKRYLDFGSGQMAAALGHNHPRYVEAVKRSLETISHSSKTFLNVDRLELHRRLGEILTPPLQKTLFLVSGSDAIEAAIDLARKATGGVDVLALDMALHGSTSFVTRSLTFGWGRSKHGLAAPGTSAILTPYAYRSPLAGGNDFVEKCLQTSFEIADANFTAKPAAVILEPVLSAGGIIVPPPGYVKALAKMAHERGMLLIMDESQTGLGKTGKMWGHLHEDVVPDIMTVSKHFGAGLPVSAVCTTAAIADQAVGNGYFATRSHACDPIVCAAGVASIDIVQEEKLVERAAAIGRRMQAQLEAMTKDVEAIGDIRGRGVLYGVELVQDRGSRVPADALARAVVAQCQTEGLLVQARGSHGRMNVIRLVPPMVSTDAQIDQGLSILGQVLRSASRVAASKAA
ncbi:MAG TPA: aminotransferase class III-fold pyridoxal phosphate-dependent enzyme [Reyranella sp.]|jgi:2,2-dialkylglycine decarboxylase (pyruvate)|nr:aminotransferase class III-fold pyridoxal phosphate-dependent enzyme [Reyranella sp.]